MAKILLLLMVILVGHNHETKATSLFTGVKYEINRIDAHHMVGSLAEMPFGEELGFPKTATQTGGAFLSILAPLCLREKYQANEILIQKLPSQRHEGTE